MTSTNPVDPAGSVPAGPALVGPAFWRRNPFLASSMRAIVMTLVGDRFSAMGPDGTAVWDAPASGVSGSLGRLGTLKITVGGQKFAIVGRGSLGGMEHGHTVVQRQYLHDVVSRNPESRARDLGALRDALNACGASIS